MARQSRLDVFLRKWDSGSRPSRLRQLEEFVQLCTDMTGPQLEAELENGASLLLARISAWLRLSYALGHSVALPLQAITIFVAASSGQRYLAEFVEVGGVATVIEILSLPQLPEEDKMRAMRLLMAVAAAGRHYKEIVCEGEGIEALEAFIGASKSEELVEDARDLLVTIGRGNPRFSTDVHRALLRLLRSESATSQRLACAGLRTLLKVLPSSQLYTKDENGNPQPVLHAGYCEAAVSLLSSFNLQLLYEAGQLFSVLLATEQLEEPLLRNLLKLIVDAADPKRTVPFHMQVCAAGLRMHSTRTRTRHTRHTRTRTRRTRTSRPTTARGVRLTHQCPMYDRVQASAARALGQLVASMPPEKRERSCKELELVPWLCTLLTRET